MFDPSKVTDFYADVNSRETARCVLLSEFDACAAALAEAVAQRDEERRNHKITLDREAATTAHYDAKIADIEAERDEARRIVKMYKNDLSHECLDGYPGDWRCSLCKAADEVLGGK
jgi:hypothetical protein